MAVYTAWPTETDLIALLTSAQAWDASASIDLAGLLATAVEEFEQQTGFVPFLNKELVEETRTFGAPGPIRVPPGTLMGGGKLLDLEGGLLTVPVVMLDGVTLSEGVQFWQQRYGHGSPITAIRFPSATFSKPDGITVTGAWGYCSTLPVQAFNAVLAHAAKAALPTLANRRRITAENTNGPIKAKETGPVRTEYAVASADKLSDYSGLAHEYETTWSKAVKRFQLISVE